MKIYKESIFWIASSFMLILYFGQRFEDYEAAFYFTCFFLPVIIGVSYVFSLLLVPRYLLLKRHFQFILYTIYTLIISLNLITIIMVLSFALLANYRNDELLPGSRDVFGLVILMFFVALVKAFWGLIDITSAQDQKVTSLLEKERLNKEQSMIVISNRKKIKLVFNEICYIESLGDYVKIIQRDLDPVITKERISALIEKMPDNFIRVHRSFIINKNHLRGYTVDTVIIENTEIPIGRKYKPIFKEYINSIKTEA